MAQRLSPSDAMARGLAVADDVEAVERRVTTLEVARSGLAVADDVEAVERRVTDLEVARSVLAVELTAGANQLDIQVVDGELAVAGAKKLEVDVYTSLGKPADTMTETEWNAMGGGLLEATRILTTKADGSATLGFLNKGAAALPLRVVVRPLSFAGAGDSVSLTLAAAGG